MSVTITLYAETTEEIQAILAETEAMQKALARIDWMLPPDAPLKGRANLYPASRDREGWLEWLTVYEFTSGGKLTVGMIQRRPGDTFEFHS